MSARILVWIFFSIFSISFLVSAQDCKYALNQSDPITNEENKIIDVDVSDKTVRKITDSYLNSKDSKGKSWPEFLYLTLEKNGSKYFIKYRMLKYGRDLTVITDADTNYFKLNNGTLLKLVPLIATPNYEENFTRYNVSIPIAKEQMEELARAPLMFVRLGIPEKPTFSTNEKKSQKFMMAAACIIK